MVGFFKQFELSLNDFYRQDRGGHIKVVVVITVTAPAHILPTARLDDRSDAALKRVCALCPGVSSVRTLHTFY